MLNNFLVKNVPASKDAICLPYSAIIQKAKVKIQKFQGKRPTELKISQQVNGL
jgi:hypothetical protein